VATLAILAMLAVACEPPRPRPTGGWPSNAYLCCTLRFNGSREASDAGYDYRDKTVFPAGTAVHDLRVTVEKAEFVPEGDAKVYNLEYRYGRKVMSPSEYYGRIFVEADPLREIDANAAVRQAIHDGRLLPGMSKREALMARGYPPAHHTPSIDADDWLYYSHSKLCERVRFVDGRIASIEPTEPPH
jgi:hypothetical protein